MKTKEYYMNMALKLAAKAKCMTSPNPMVGAVIVKDGEIVGKGYHRKAGEPHAEINALKEAKEKARGGEMYVTLEPCCHFNRTPPCTISVIESGIKRVIVGMFDPNPKVSGKGLKALKDAGIEVEVKVLESKCLKLNEVFIKYIQDETPFVILKMAESLDGKIATHTGDSKWVTNEKSRRYVHKMRSQVDAVLVGVDTVIADDPLLTARMVPKKCNQPKRIILDSKLRTPLTSKLLHSESPSDTIFATIKKASANQVKLFESKGVKVIVCDEKDGRVDIQHLLLILGKMSITSLIVEGGANVNAAFVESGLVDKIVVFIGGCIIGGENALSPIGGRGFETMAKSLKISDLSYRKFGNNLMIEGKI